MATGYRIRQLVVGTILERIAGAGVLIDGLRIKDGTVKPKAGGTAVLDLTDCATGEGDVALKDNLADAHTVREGDTPYTTYVTSNNAERVQHFKPVLLPVQELNMAGTGHALVYGASGSGISKITGWLILVDANAADNLQQLKMPDPAVSSSRTVLFILKNIGGESVVLRDKDGATTGVNDGDGFTLAAGAGCIVMSTGTGIFAASL